MPSRTVAISSCAFLLLLTAPLDAQTATSTPNNAQEAQPAEDEKDPRGVRFVMRQHPSFRVGNVLRVDFRAKFQTDFRSFAPDLATREGLFDLHRKRVGVQGRFLRHFEYEVERELRELDKERVDPDTDDIFVPFVPSPWRDVFVNFRYVDDVQIRAGKFKLPFGMEQLTSPTDLDFVHRALLSTYLAPARDTGAAAHGRLFRRGFGYEVGVFERDGEGARSRENRGANRTFAGRVIGKPLRLVAVPGVKELEIGIAVTSSRMSEEPLRNGLEGRTIAGKTFFDRLYVKGRRLRVGTEWNWSPGPFSLKGEFMRVQDDRRNQGLFEEDLPDAIAEGWYLSSTWALTGEPKAAGIEPRKAFLRGGIGAVELGARYEQLRFKGGRHPDPPSRSSRAARILGNSDRAWTVGVNWYVNRFVKVQANAIHETIEDFEHPSRTPILSRDRFWSSVLRLQFVL